MYDPYRPLAIDKIPLPLKRPVEMQVLVLGLSRTGTYCMFLPIPLLFLVSSSCYDLR